MAWSAYKSGELADGSTPTRATDWTPGCGEECGDILVTATNVTLKLDYRKPDGATAAWLRIFEGIPIGATSSAAHPAFP